jgi:hypothetical protein
MSADGKGGLDTARLARALALIVFVTAVFLFVAAEELPSELFQIGAVAIGAVALVTAITSFLIAASSYYEELG